MASTTSHECLINKNGTIDCPKWIADKLGLCVQDVSSMEVTGSAKDLNAYFPLIEYLAVRAIDPDKIWTEADNEQFLSDSGDGDDEETMKTTMVSVDSSNGCNKRLSSQWLGPSSEFTEIEGERRKPKYYMGLGYARVVVAGVDDVFIAHVSHGVPIPVGLQPKMYRTVILFAKDNATSQAVLDTALAWSKKTKIVTSRAKKGQYTLWTLQIGRVTSWDGRGIKQARSLESIFLKPGLKKGILADAEKFLQPSEKKWYQDNGIPYRYTFCFYGPPGVGKTSLIGALAGELRLPLCFLGIATTNVESFQVEAALVKVPKPSIVVIEDIDSLFGKDREQKTANPLTHAALLNILDGFSSSENLIFVITANRIDTIDDALKRAGRINRRCKFEEPGREELIALFGNYFPNESYHANKFADKVFERKEKNARSIATLQQHFIRCREASAEACVDSLAEFFETFYPDGDSDTQELYYT